MLTENISVIFLTLTRVSIKGSLCCRSEWYVFVCFFVVLVCSALYPVLSNVFVSFLLLCVCVFCFLSLQVTKILKTNTRVCGALGPMYIHQLTAIFLDVLKIYQYYSEHISQAVAEQVPTTVAT